MKTGVFAAAFFAAALSTCGAVASAEPVDATLALSVNALNGQHETASGNDRFTFAPLPLAELTLRAGRNELRAEGLPPIPFNYGSGTAIDIGTRTTRLSVLNLTYRRLLSHGWFAGIGETTYTQRTDWTNIPPGWYEATDQGFIPINGHESEYSRVSGIRLEAGRTISLGPVRLEAAAGLNPAMHGNDNLSIHTYPICTANGCAPQDRPFSRAEDATQVDAYARLARRISHSGDLLFGIRYINITARYADGSLSDRNVGWAPTLGYRIRL